jgi:hypothetical protein
LHSFVPLGGFHFGTVYALASSFSYSFIASTLLRVLRSVYVLIRSLTLIVDLARRSLPPATGLFHPAIRSVPPCNFYSFTGLRFIVRQSRVLVFEVDVFEDVPEALPL